MRGKWTVIFREIELPVVSSNETMKCDRPHFDPTYVTDDYGGEQGEYWGYKWCEGNTPEFGARTKGVDEGKGFTVRFLEGYHESEIYIRSYVCNRRELMSHQWDC